MDLRPELMPPALDEALVERLAEWANTIDGARLGEWEDLLDEFNREAGTDLNFTDFQCIYGAMEHATWVRQLLSEPAVKPLPDVTYEELLELITRICRVHGAEHEIYFWLRFLEVNLDPRISDLIYWPGEYFGDGNNARELSPKEILDTALRARRPNDEHA
jgi:hypothetical protein